MTIAAPPGSAGHSGPDAVGSRRWSLDGARITASPGGAPEASIETRVASDSRTTPARPATRIGRLFRLLGPGLITGASDDDPSAIGTYTTAGASLGYATLWIPIFLFPLLASVQYICAKIAMVSGLGLAGVVRQQYSRAVLYPLVCCLVLANTITAGADIGAIAAGLGLVVPLPIGAMIVPIAALILGFQFWGSYQLIERTFKWLTLALFAYIAAAFFAKPDFAQVLRGTLLPSLRTDGAFLSTLIAMLGASVSPYLFFWLASHKVEEERSLGRRYLWQRKGATDDELTYAGWDVNIGIFFANLAVYFILLATAATLFAHGQTEVHSATDAAVALRPLAGDAAGWLLAVGLIGTGFLGVPVLTGSAAYATSEAFGWNSGLNQKPHRAKRFYGAIGLSTLIGLALNYLGINAFDALFWASVINGLLAPLLLVLLMLIANNRAVMGDRVNGRWANALGWTTTGLMCAAALGLVATWLVGLLA